MIYRLKLSRYRHPPEEKYELDCVHEEGGLAICRSSPQADWQILHKATGLPIVDAKLNSFRLQRDAKKALKALVPLADWTASKPEIDWEATRAVLRKHSS